LKKNHKQLQALLDEPRVVYTPWEDQNYKFMLPLNLKW
jgi:hypothetical protein